MNGHFSSIGAHSEGECCTIRPVDDSGFLLLLVFFAHNKNPPKRVLIKPSDILSADVLSVFVL